MEDQRIYLTDNCEPVVQNLSLKVWDDLRMSYSRLEKENDILRRRVVSVEDGMKSYLFKVDRSIFDRNNSCLVTKDGDIINIIESEIESVNSKFDRVLSELREYQEVIDEYRNTRWICIFSKIKSIIKITKIETKWK